MNQKHLQKMLIGGAGLLASASLINSARGQSADALIDKLVEKGILTVKEANQLREESDKGFTSAYSVKSGLPDWVTSMKFNGDFRGRFEQTSAENPAYVDRNRYRYRLRFGVTATLQDSFEVGFRLASANLITQNSRALGGNPVSANTDLGLGNSRKFVFMDAAYGKWTPIHSGDWTVSGTIGKMDNPFALSNMIWDYDIQPEGAAFQAAHNFNDKHALKLNSAFIVLDEFNQTGGNPGVGPSHDPYVIGAQLLWEAKWSPKIDTALGLSAFTIAGKDALSNTNAPNLNAGNTRVSSGPRFGQLAYNFNPIVVNASVTYKAESFPLYKGEFPIKLAGEYLKNPGAPANNAGWWGGVTLGKAGHKGQWELSYRYQRLGADAWYEEFPDDDNGAYYQAGHSLLTASGNGANFFGGTNVKGHLVKATYSFTDYLSFSLTFYLNELIIDAPGGSVNSAGHLMADLMWKF